ncbi:MAG: arginine repressor [Actinomycetota bacterium]|jgi:transcriptional regulator of arginine metabolism
MKYADSRTARHHLIQDILANKSISSQNELLNELKKKGFAVTQTTLSRDLDELGAIKKENNKGQVKYSIPMSDPDRISESGVARNRLEKLASELVVGVDHSANLAVIHTPAGAAQLVASIVDHAALENVIGTIAGDNTVLVITKGLKDGESVARQIWEYVQFRR